MSASVYCDVCGKRASAHYPSEALHYGEGHPRGDEDWLRSAVWPAQQKEQQRTWSTDLCSWPCFLTWARGKAADAIAAEAEA